MSAKLISIIGPPAVGKTTMATYLAQALDAELVCEDFDGNPFLADSYLGCADASLPAQLYYLLSRASQLSLSRWPEKGLIVSDYGFCQDAIYAAMRLGEGDLAMYRSIAAKLQPVVKPPDVVVHIDASVVVMRRRVAQRGRDFEKAFDDEFLRRMRRAYKDLTPALNCPVFFADGDTQDFRRLGKVDPLVKEIVAAL